MYLLSGICEFHKDCPIYSRFKTDMLKNIIISNYCTSEYSQCARYKKKKNRQKCPYMSDARRKYVRAYGGSLKSKKACSFLCTLLTLLCGFFFFIQILLGDEDWLFHFLNDLFGHYTFTYIISGWYIIHDVQHDAFQDRLQTPGTGVPDYRLFCYG